MLAASINIPMANLAHATFHVWHAAHRALLSAHCTCPVSSCLALNAAANLGAARDAALAGSGMDVSYGNTLRKPVKVPTRSGRLATDGTHLTDAPQDSPDRQRSVADQVTALHQISACVSQPSSPGLYP